LDLEIALNGVSVSIQPHRAFYPAEDALKLSDDVISELFVISFHAKLGNSLEKPK
jgi:hypothetical protein